MQLNRFFVLCSFYMCQPIWNNVATLFERLFFFFTVGRTKISIKLISHHYNIYIYLFTYSPIYHNAIYTKCPESMIVQFSGKRIMITIMAPTKKILLFCDLPFTAYNSCLGHYIYSIKPSYLWANYSQLNIMYRYEIWYSSPNLFHDYILLSVLITLLNS